MRNAFSDHLYELAIKDESIYVVVADISPAGSMLEFRRNFPDRFINTGVGALPEKVNSHLFTQSPLLRL